MGAILETAYMATLFVFILMVIVVIEDINLAGLVWELNTIRRGL